MKAVAPIYRQVKKINASVPPPIITKISSSVKYNKNKIIQNITLPKLVSILKMVLEENKSICEEREM